MEEKESENLEFKGSLSDLEGILATVSAFSNTKGGRILIGVEDNGKVIGVEIGKRTLEDLSNKIVQSTEPRVYPEIKVEKIDDKNIVEIRVSERSDKPVFAKGIAYKRVGKNNVKMDRDEIVNLLRKTYELSYEDVEIAEIEEIDLEKVRSFIRRAVETRSTMMPNHELTVLRNLGMVEGKVKAAAILLFGKSPQANLSWATVKIGKFVKSENIPVMEKEIGGDLTEQIEKGYAEILSLIRKEIRVEGARRRSIYEYPPEAIRELVVNAVTHRDYSVRSPIYVRIFEDKILFENPGGLPLGITVNDLKKPHKSVLRNPKIANALYNLGYIEKWGIGTLEVLRRCILNGNGEPVFSSNGTFRVEVRSRYEADMSDEEKIILNYLREKGEASRRELEKPLKLSESMVRKLLERLQSKSLVVKEGKGKKIKYRLAF